MNAVYRPTNFSTVLTPSSTRGNAAGPPIVRRSHAFRALCVPAAVLPVLMSAVLFLAGGCPPTDLASGLNDTGAPAATTQENSAARPSGDASGGNATGQSGAANGGSDSTNGSSSGDSASGSGSNANDNASGAGDGGDSSGGDGNGDGTASGSDGSGGDSSGGGDDGDDGSSDDGAGGGAFDPASVVFDPNPTPDAVPTQTPPTLAAGPLTIVTLGDSLTEGSGDESLEGGGYPFRLQSAVQARRADSQVLNFGHSGWSSTDLIQGIDGVPSELDQGVAAKADIACVWIGSNDLWALYAYGPEEGTTPDLEAADLKAFAANIDTILSRLKASGAALYIALSDDQSLRPAAGTALCCISPDELKLMSAQIIRYNNVMIAAAKRHGATVIDFYNTTFFNSVETLDADGIHPNAAGYDGIAAMWFAAMQPALGQ